MCDYICSLAEAVLGAVSMPRCGAFGVRLNIRFTIRFKRGVSMPRCGAFGVRPSNRSILGTLAPGSPNNEEEIVADRPVSGQFGKTPVCRFSLPARLD